MNLNDVIAEFIPYLENPLVLVGLALFLVIGIHRTLVNSKILSPINPVTSAKVIQSVLRYGFGIVIAIIVFGVIIEFFSHKFNEERRNAELRASVAEERARIYEDHYIYKPISQIREEDISIISDVRFSARKGEYKITIKPTDEEFWTSMYESEITLSVDNGPYNYNLENLSLQFAYPYPPSNISIKILDKEDVEYGPFSFQVDFKSAAKEALLDLVQKRKIVNCVYIEVGGPIRCDISHILSSMINKIEIRSDRAPFLFSMFPKNQKKNENVATSNNDMNYLYSYLLPVKHSNLHGTITIWDDSVINLGRILVTEKSGYMGYRNEAAQIFYFSSSSKYAPMLVGVLTNSHKLYETGGRWNVYPIVGSEVESIIWTIHEGGINIMNKKEGFFSIQGVWGDELGAGPSTSKQSFAPIQVTYEYSDGTSKLYHYEADWTKWLSFAAMKSLDLNNIITCRKAYNGNAFLKHEIFSAYCYLSAPVPPNRVFTDIFWGTSPQKLKKLDESTMDKFFLKVDKILEDRKAESSGKDYDLGTLLSLSDLIVHSRIFKKSLSKKVVNWRTLNNHPDNILLIAEIEDAVYFQFALHGGDKSSIIRAPIR